MKSLQFPNILSSAKTNVASDHDATLSNLKLLLKTNKNSLYGDPYFGTDLNQIIFSQNSKMLADLIIDDIYTNILMFMPQLKVKRSGIKVYRDEDKYIWATVSALNVLDYTTNMYTIQLTDTNTTES